jgi:hypothetical protein
MMANLGVLVDQPATNSVSFFCHDFPILGKKELWKIENSPKIQI